MDVNIGLLSKRLGRLLAGEEGALPDAANQHIQNLRSEIGILTSLLTDYEVDMNWLMFQILGDTKEKDSPDLMAIVKEINCFVHEAEKVIDTFIISNIQQKSESGTKDAYDAALRLQSKIVDIRQRMQQVQHISTDIIDELKSFRTKVRRYYSSSLSPDFEEKMEELMDILIEGEPQLSFVFVVDISGFEKIPFNAEVYHSNFAKNYFDCCARVSFNFNPEEMLDDLMKSVMPPPVLAEFMDKDYQPKKMALRDYLRNRRFLIVLDQVATSHVWSEIKEAFPDDQNGSRVLTTVTHAEVVQYFLMEELDFLRRNLEPGGMLTTTIEGIQFVYLYFGRTSLQEDMEQVFHIPILSQVFSISELPLYLKQCLLYFSVLPNRYEICTRQLYQLWIAEGFTPDNSEATAEEYLEELINRGFVQVKKRRPGGTIKVCIIPSFVRTASQLMAQMIGFVNFVGVESTTTPGIHFLNVLGPDLSDKISKRLAFHVDFLSKYDLFTLSDAYLHSLLHPASLSNHHPSIDCEKICKKFKHLKILNLGSLVLDQFPAGTENFLLLRYLKLNIPSLKRLPLSICNLLNLYTLDMPSSYIDHTPPDIWKMSKLRHLNFGYIKLPAHPENNCRTLKNLNFPSALHPSSCTLDILGRLPNLQSLRTYGDLSFYQSFFSKSLCELSSLHSLKLVNESTMIEFSQLVLSEFQFPQTLTQLSLSNTKLKDDPMPVLEKLPHLKVLKLKQNSYSGRKLACGSNSFLCLKVLHLLSMLWLDEWSMETGAMPKLETLIINPCAYLRRLPEELWRIKTLSKLDLQWPQSELRQRLRDFEDIKQYDIQLYPYGL